MLFHALRFGLGQFLEYVLGELSNCDATLMICPIDTQHGQALRAVFDQDSILNDVVRHGPVILTLGAKRHADCEAISRWDFLAATELVNQLKTREPRAEVELLDVPC